MRISPRSFVHRFAAPLFAAIGAFALTTPLHASESVGSIQKALKDRGFFFREPDGNLDDDTRAGLKRFQIREGLKATGEIDDETRAALKKAPASPKAAGSAPTLSARERAQTVTQSDREFLDKIDPVEVAERPPVEPPSRPDTKEAPPPPPPSTRTVPSIGAPADVLTEAEAQGFVQSYLKAATSKTPEQEVGYYDDRVEYFDSGKVGRDFIRKDQGHYYRRWPGREFKLLGAPQIQRAGSESATVRFQIHYALRGDGGTASGQTENIVRLRKTDDGWKIAAIRERKIRD
jgi:peptidoglycan hydrolase-like protein with peptidoglycan-binding domain